MIFKGDYNFFIDGKTVSIEDIFELVTTDMTASIEGLNVHYTSPKKENKKAYNYLDKIQELLKEADENQKQNGGILEGVEFPFDMSEYATPYLKALQEQKVIEDWNKSRPLDANFRQFDSPLTLVDKIKNFSILNLEKQPEQKEKAIDSYLQGSREDSLNKLGQKHNSLKAPLDILQTRQFPKALQLLALATAYGNHKYKDTDSDYLNFKRVEGGSQTYLDAQSRHATDRNNLDNESGLHHFIHSIWNGIAALELWAEENEINIEEYSKNYLKSLVVSK